MAGPVALAGRMETQEVPQVNPELFGFLSSMVRISILTPVFKSATFRRALDSIENSSIDKSLIKLIVLNDGDHEGADSIKSLLSGYSTKFEIRYFCNEQNRRIGFCRQKLIDLVDTSHFTFLDSDDELGPEFLAQAHQCIEQKDYDMIVGKLVLHGYGPDDTFYSKDIQLRSFYTDSPIDLTHGGVEAIFQGRVFKKEVFTSPPAIRLPDLPTSEDMGPIFCTRYKVKKFIGLDVPSYVKWFEASSITSTIGQNTVDIIKVTQKFIRNFETSNNVGPQRYRIVVFSKDRPLQLLGLLESYYRLIKKDYDPLAILWTASSSEYVEGYFEIARRFNNIPFFDQNPNPLKFKEILLGILSDSDFDRVLFLVDDMVFTRQFSLHDFDKFKMSEYVPCLDLGKNVTYCYVSDRQLRIPSIVEEGAFIEWRWNDGECSVWNLPTRASSNIYDRQELRELLEPLSFSSPNTMEIAMASEGLSRFRSRKGVAYATSCLLSLPFNLVQTDHPANRHGQLTKEFFLKEWKNGKKLETFSLENIPVNSTHAIVPINLVNRAI
jgi:hypothetical protein